VGTVTAVVNLKGGSGKTTLALCLVSAWREKGEKTVLLDADGQGTATDILGIGAARGVDVPGIVQLPDWRLLRRQARALAEDYDRVVIDTPARLNRTSSAAISASELVLIPVCPGAAGHCALGPTLDLVDEWVALADAPPRVAMVLNMVDHTRVGREHRPTVEELLEAREDAPLLLKAELRRRTSHNSAQSVGQSTMDYASGGDAAHEVQALVAELGRRRLVGKSRKSRRG